MHRRDTCKSALWIVQTFFWFFNKSTLKYFQPCYVSSPFFMNLFLCDFTLYLHHNDTMEKEGQEFGQDKNLMIREGV